MPSTWFILNTYLLKKEQVSHKIKHLLTIYDLAIVLLGIYAEELKILCSHQNLHTDIYITFIHNHQSLEAAEMNG